jgi:hypothetical protein
MTILTTKVNTPQVENCPICLQSLASEKAVVNAHDNMHRFHEECLKVNLVFSRLCPLCRHPLTESLRSRVITTSATFLANASLGIVSGAVLNELCIETMKIGYDSIPVIYTLARSMGSNELVAASLTVAGGLGINLSLGSGIVFGLMLAARTLKNVTHANQINETAQALGLVTGTIFSMISSTATGALVGGIIAGSISML